MRIAVISDTHDHIRNLERAIEEINKESVKALFHCGDLVSPFMIEKLAAFDGPVHVVFGNNEGDKFSIAQAAKSAKNIKLHGEVGFFDSEPVHIAFTHKPEFARGLACNGNYTAVLCGHTHRFKIERVGSVWLVNPGELMELIEPPGWIVFDPETGELEHHPL